MKKVKIIENTLSTVKKISATSLERAKPLLNIFERVRGPLACLVLIVLGTLIFVTTSKIFPHAPSVHYAHETITPEEVIQDSYDDLVFSFPYRVGVPESLMSLSIQMPDRSRTTIGEIMSADSAKPLVIIPWTSWCRDCRYTMEMMSTELYDNYSQDMQFLALNQGERFSVFRRFSRNSGLQFMVARDASNIFAKLMNNQGTTPSAIVIANSAMYWITEPINFDTFQMLKHITATEL